MDSEESGTSEQRHDGSGHRARLRGRILAGGVDAVHDHEILEYLLALAIPRRDTKGLAKQLLARFGTLSAVLAAHADSLNAQSGMGETSTAAIKIVEIAAKRMAQQKASEAPVLSSWQALIDYLTIDMAHLKRERVRVLYLNSKNMLISDYHMGDGSLDQAQVYPREIIRRGLDVGAAALILVHNHPRGSPEPSRQDIAITRNIIEAGRLLGISVHDHIIIGTQGHVSLKAKGVI